MKKLLLITVLSFSALVVRAQGVDFEDFFNKYTGKDGYTTLDFTGALLNMLTGGQSGDAFSGIKSLKMVVAENPGKAFEKEALSTTNRAGFKKLFDVSSGQDKFQIWHKEKGKGTGKSKDKTEYILWAMDGEDATIIYVEGDIDISNLSKLSKINIVN